MQSPTHLFDGVPHLFDGVPKVEWRSRVRVPDGRIGKVIGFYRRENDSVLVRFGSGETAEFLTPEVELLV